MKYDVFGLEPTVISDLIEISPYLSNKILNIVVSGNVMEAEIVEGSEEEVRQVLEDLKSELMDTKKQNFQASIQVVKNYPKKPLIQTTSIFEELLEKKALYENLGGGYLYSGILLAVLKYFSEKMTEFGKKNFDGIKEIQVPSLIDFSKYREAGYLRNFPHHLYFCTKIKSNYSDICKVSKISTEEELEEHLDHHQHMLSHAACSCVYPLHRDQRMDSQEIYSYIVDGKCFRNEDKKLHELLRLNEFRMKEFVFVGNRDKVTQAIEKSISLWDFFIETFELNAVVETATDSFMGDHQQLMKMFQMLSSAKLEFKLEIPSTGAYYPVCSANYHRNHFTKAYNIQSEDGYCDSACFGIGLERMAYLFLSQKGLNVEKWNASAIEEISRYVDLKEF